MGTKPLVVYLHRYPPEIEAVQYPALRRLIDCLLIKYEVVYVSMKYHKPADQEIRRGFCAMEIPLIVDQTRPADKWIKTILYYLLLPATLWRLKRLHPSFIICKEQLPFVPFMVSLLRVPMFITVSDWWWSILLGGSWFGRKWAKLVEQLEVRQWNRAGAWVVVHSRAERRLVVRKGMDAGRIRIIYPPILPGVYYPCETRAERKRLGLNEDTWILAIHGIIRQGKGYGQVLKWWKDLVKIHPQWRLLIIGGGGGELWCRNHVHHLKLDHYVVMTGWLPSQSDVNRYLNAADCLLVVRRNSEDNIGNIPSALFHSLTTGKPTVATGLPGMSEIVRDKVDGFLFEPDSYESFMKALEYVAANPGEAEKVGKNGTERVRECFDPDKAAQQHVELIDEILGKAMGEKE